MNLNKFNTKLQGGYGLICDIYTQVQIRLGSESPFLTTFTQDTFFLNNHARAISMTLMPTEGECGSCKILLIETSRSYHGTSNGSM
jgi:hypothetical protein